MKQFKIKVTILETATEPGFLIVEGPDGGAMAVRKEHLEEFTSKGKG